MEEAWANVKIDLRSTEAKIEAIEARLDDLEGRCNDLAERIEKVYMTASNRWESHMLQLSKLDHKIEERAPQGVVNKNQWARELCFKGGHQYAATSDSSHIFCQRCGDLRSAKPITSHATTPFKNDDFVYTSPDATGKTR